MKKYSIPMIVSVDKLEGTSILAGVPAIGPMATFAALFKGDTANIFKKKSAMIKKEMKIDMRR